MKLDILSLIIGGISWSIITCGWVFVTFYLEFLKDRAMIFRLRFEIEQLKEQLNMENKKDGQQ